METISNLFPLLNKLIEGKLLKCYIKDKCFFGKFDRIYSHIDATFCLSNCIELNTGKVWDSVGIFSLFNPKTGSGNYSSNKIKISDKITIIAKKETHWHKKSDGSFPEPEVMTIEICN